MKLMTLSLLLLFSTINSAISQEKLENLGLISELVYLKYSTENTAIRILNDSNIQEPTKIEFVKSYNKLKTISDQWLLQLIADMSRKSSTKKFKKIDQIVAERSIKNLGLQGYNKKNVKIYLKNLKIIFEKHQELLSDNKDIAGTESLPIQQIDGILTFITSTITTINENKRKKVEKISSILDSLRLRPLQEILKPKEKKKDK